MRSAKVAATFEERQLPFVQSSPTATLRSEGAEERAYGLVPGHR
jgi:hypothetical protein